MLKVASVFGLLGEFNHEIRLQEGWEFAIAYGLNGVGKTKFLELVNATINLDLGRIADARFDYLNLQSDDNQSLSVEKHFFEENDDDSRVSVKFILRGKQIEPITWESPVGLDQQLRKYIMRTTPYEPLDGSYAVWTDPSDGEIISYNELRERYGRRVRSGLEHTTPSIPDDITRFLESNRTYLIETQRLAVASMRNSRLHAENRSSPAWSVDAYAGDLKRRIESSLAVNSLHSQSLDRSFPKRIIEWNISEAMEEETIRDKYEEQAQKRKRLVDIGLTTAEIDVPLPRQELEPWQRAVMTTYLDDNNSKLSTFDQLLAKISLLEEIVNSRFLKKRIKVTASDGLTLTSTTFEREIPVSGLSTGEQHELVLLYNLLFRIEPGTLVLIDEPEISLHVTWQKKFINDVLRIAKLSDFNFIVATHSPQIIDKWWSRTVQLGPSEE